MPPTAPVPESAAPAIRPALCWGLALGVLAAAGGETLRVVVGRNLHTVVPGRIYRCAQPSPDALEEMVHRHGIRTVINLRGCCSSFPWYLEEARATHRLGLAQEDICLAVNRMPAIHEARRLAEVLTRAEQPVLLHCRQGADRTGLAAVMALLLCTDADLKTARRHLAPRYGHLPVGRLRELDRFFDLYEDWLGRTGQVHHQAAFRRWLDREYRGGPQGYEVEVLEAPSMVAARAPWSVRLRFHNRSCEPWQFSAASTAGIHAVYVLVDDRGHSLAQGRAGLFDRTVAVGDSVDVLVDLPAVAGPGACVLTVDLRQESGSWFYQSGNEPYRHRVEVR